GQGGRTAVVGGGDGVITSGGVGRGPTSAGLTATERHRIGFGGACGVVFIGKGHRPGRGTRCTGHGSAVGDLLFLTHRLIRSVGTEGHGRGRVDRHLEGAAAVVAGGICGRAIDRGRADREGTP